MGETPTPRKSKETTDNNVTQETEKQLPLPTMIPPSYQQSAITNPQLQQTPVQPQVQIAPEKIQKLQELLAQLIMDSTDLGLALGTIECPYANNCPLVKASKQIAKSLVEIRNLTKQ
jgi:type II secretory pathway component PulM